MPNYSFRESWSGAWKYGHPGFRSNDIGKTTEASKNCEMWECLRSKTCVCLLLSLFVIEVTAALGLGIYFFAYDGTLLQQLFGTATNCHHFQQLNSGDILLGSQIFF